MVTNIRVLLCTLLLALSLEGQRIRSVQHPAAPLPTNALYTEGGYADAISVVQGGSLTMRIATSVSPFALQVIDLRDQQQVAKIEGLTSAPQDCTGRHLSGCGWQATHTLEIPLSWPSGHYAARFPTRFGTRNIFFVVRPANPGATSRTLLITATHTYQAYNGFGGRNVYPSTSPNRSFAVTYDRPFHDYDGLGRFPVWDAPFLQFLREEGRSYEVATDVDLEEPSLLTPYDLVVIVGHSEYWTRTAREHLEQFSAAGGHIAIFGGNTMWWQIRLRDAGRTMVVYKDAALDPNRDPATTTVNWFNAPVFDPENSILGASFRHAGFVNTDASQPRSAYTVATAEHWALAGTGVARGDAFGARAAGGETDGVLFHCDAEGFPFAVDGSDATPLNYEILATVPATSGFGTVGLYTNAAGGTVFNAGTQDWAIALDSDPVVRRITENVLDRLSTGEPQLPRFVERDALTRELFNCAKVRDDLLPGWRGEEEGARITTNCAREGRSGLQLGAGGPRALIARNFAPHGAGSSDLEVRVDLHVPAATRIPDTTVGLVTIHSRVNEVNTRRARIELQQLTAQEHAIRLTLYAADGASTVKTQSIPLDAGWHSLRMRWSSPGEASLTVDDHAPLTLLNATGQQTANEVQLFYPPSAPEDGPVCLDNLWLAGTAGSAGRFAAGRAAADGERSSWVRVR
ncbi:MAG TPA: N,N-dimethylformamidase beta subunit family domain-containing protein [Thermoanaerobaculia bacterium]|nr:N,N-dimethylformamidase beta subunit family domain-containing protein [Thermoanaerobaculia bacterium]